MLYIKNVFTNNVCESNKEEIHKNKMEYRSRIEKYLLLDSKVLTETVIKPDDSTGNEGEEDTKGNDDQITCKRRRIFNG